jgi:hypothetical protein
MRSKVGDEAVGDGAPDVGEGGAGMEAFRDFLVTGGTFVDGWIFLISLVRYGMGKREEEGGEGDLHRCACLLFAWGESRRERRVA